MSNGLKMQSVIVVVVLCVVGYRVTMALGLCENNEFFNEKSQKCQTCSLCPEQLQSIICSETSDTQCVVHMNLSFIDFSFMNKQNSGAETILVGSPTVVQSADEEQYWKHLAFTLIALLTVMVIITTVLVLVICHSVRNYTWLCKAVTQEQVEDAESGYVIIHRFMPPPLTTSPPAASCPEMPESTHPLVSYHHRSSRNRPYKPKRRLMNEYVDDVFESDDSAVSRTVRMPLPTVLEKSDSDNPDSPRSPRS